jgi:23S rRNA pseudouridine1911/1915/1917 synthase
MFLWGKILCLFVLSWKNLHFPPKSTFIRGQNFNVVVPADEVSLAEPSRLDVFLSKFLQNHTRSQIGCLCDSKKVFINSKVKHKSYKVRPGDVVEFSIESVEALTARPERIPLDVLYEDEQLIAVNKPVGMVVHPAVGSPNGTFVNALLYHLGSRGDELCGYNNANDDATFDDAGDDTTEISLSGSNNRVLELSGKGANVLESKGNQTSSIRPGIVHRIDKGTSGVLLAGKTPAAVGALSALFSSRRVRKVYIAVCIGNPGDTTINKAIGRSLKNRQLMATVPEPRRKRHPNSIIVSGRSRSGGLTMGRSAITHVKTLCFDGKLSVCLLRIETGR